jgi:hypothetical protein
LFKKPLKAGNNRVLEKRKECELLPLGIEYGAVVSAEDLKIDKELQLCELSTLNCRA